MRLRGIILNSLPRSFLSSLPSSIFYSRWLSLSKYSDPTRWTLRWRDTGEWNTVHGFQVFGVWFEFCHPIPAHPKAATSQTVSAND